MSYSKLKYGPVLFLLLIFIFSGSQTVLPLFSNFFKSTAQKEVQINTKADTSGEKSGSEKAVDKKECFNLSLFDNDSLFKFAPIAKIFPLREYHFKLKVYLAIQIPPPKFIC